MKSINRFATLVLALAVGLFACGLAEAKGGHAAPAKGAPATAKPADQSAKPAANPAHTHPSAPHKK